MIYSAVIYIIEILLVTITVPLAAAFTSIGEKFKRLESKLNNAIIRILLQKEFNNSMTIKSIIQRTWSIKYSLILFFVLFTISRQLFMLHILPPLDGITIKEEYITIALTVSLVFIIYGIIIGYINKRTVISIILIRLTLVLIMFLIGLDYLGIFSILDVFFSTLGYFVLTDNFGEWIFANRYGEGSSSGRNYSNGDPREDSGGSGGPEDDLSILLTTTPITSEDMNDIFPGDISRIKGEPCFMNTATVYPPRYIFTTYDLLNVELQLDYRNGNKSILSKCINKALESITNARNEQLPEELKDHIWGYLNSDIIYPSQFNKKLYTNHLLYPEDDVKLYEIFARKGKYADILNESFWSFDTLDYNTRRNIADYYAGKIRLNTDLFEELIEQWKRYNNLYLEYRNKYFHPGIYHREANETDVHLIASYREFHKKLLDTATIIDTCANNHRSLMIDWLRKGKIQTHDYSLTDRILNLEGAYIGPYDHEYSSNWMNKASFQKVFTSPILSEVYWVRYGFVYRDKGYGLCSRNY